MRKLLLIASLAGMGLSVSCSHDEMADAPKGDELPAVSYTVSAEEASAGWQNMPDGMRTRGKARTVADVQTLYGGEMTAIRPGRMLRRAMSSISKRAVTPFWGQTSGKTPWQP